MNLRVETDDDDFQELLIEITVATAGKPSIQENVLCKCGRKVWKDEQKNKANSVTKLYTFKAGTSHPLFLTKESFAYYEKCSFKFPIKKIEP